MITRDLEARLVERARRDPEFRARLLADPRAAIAEELAVEIPAGLTIRVVEEQPGEAVLVLPAPVTASAIAEGDLGDVAGGGTGLLRTNNPDCRRTLTRDCPSPPDTLYC